MTSANGFWAAVAAGLERVSRAETVCDVFAAFPGSAENGNSGAGFFPGSGGDATIRAALQSAGWRTVWAEASYHYAMRAPGGEILVYIEGDLRRGTERDARRTA